MKTKKKLHRPFSLKQYMILVLSSLIIITTLILLIFPTKLYEELYYQQTEYDYPDLYGNQRRLG